MKKFLSILIAVLVIGGGAFYGGTMYTKAKQPARGNFVRLGQGIDTQGIGGANMRGGQAGGFIGGEIISKDDNSITVKLRDGGSKLIFYSLGTEISKFASGVAADLEVGKNISVNGKTNSDGSLTADSIQVRPAASIPKP